jgi:nucleoid DNA-binding protein
MNYKELVTAVSIENKIPAKQAKIIIESVFNKIADCINSDELLLTPKIRMAIINRPERTVPDVKNGGTKVVAASKFGRLTIRPPKITP